MKIIMNFLQVFIDQPLWFAYEDENILATPQFLPLVEKLDEYSETISMLLVELFNGRNSGMVEKAKHSHKWLEILANNIR